MHSAAEALAAQLPNVERVTLADQTHVIDPSVIAPVVTEFFKK